MKTFLEHVAADIIRRYGTQLNRIAVVFPNKRASLFLDDALARIAGKPIWSPAYMPAIRMSNRRVPTPCRRCIR